jgi:endoglucanase
VPGVGRSTEFEIAKDVYEFATKTSMRAFYLWRCGMAVHGEHDGNVYETEDCHLNDGYEDYIGNPGSQRDGTGGWHDAGDHGKYTVNAGVTWG